MNMETSPDPEVSHQADEDLIKACAATVATAERRVKIRSLLGENRDWVYVLELCQAHGVSSLVCFNLEACAPDLVPREILAVFQGRFKANACRNLFLTQELLALVQEFRKNGIETIPFKGPVLAITAYGNLALREFLDLDILVQKEKMFRAHELLATLGYRPPAGQLTQDYLKSQLGCDYIRADACAALELHWSFVQKWLGFNVDLAAIWAAPQQLKVGPVPVLILPADITLLYLCAHGAKHCWSRLCWVVDVAEILRARPELDWDRLLAMAESSGCQRTLFIGLHLAGNLLGAPIPERVWTGIRQDHMAVLLARNLGKQMFASRKNASRNWFGWGRDWFYIRTKERWREKVAYLELLAGLAFQPSEKDRRWIHLPHWLNWLYPFLRPIRVTWQSLPAFPRGNAAMRVTK